MFTGFEEKNQERVKLVDVDPHALSILVNYVYTATVDVTEANVQTLLPAANLLQLIDVHSEQSSVSEAHDVAPHSSVLVLQTLLDVFEHIRGLNTMLYEEV